MYLKKQNKTRYQWLNLGTSSDSQWEVEHCSNFMKTHGVSEKIHGTSECTVLFFHLRMLQIQDITCK